MTLPIINQPQVAILSTDGVKRRPVVVDLPDGSEAIAIHSVGNITLTWDHRAFDGAYAAAFLRGDQGDPRDPRLGGRAGVSRPTRRLGSHDAPHAVARAGAATARRWALQRALHARSPDDHLLLLEHPHVYTLGVRADLGHVLVPPGRRRGRPRAHRPGRRRHLPRAGPARRLPDRVAVRPSGAAAARWPTPSPTCARSSSSSSTRWPTSACPAPAACASTRASGSTPTATTPARSPPSACASPGAGRCTGSPSTSTPTCATGATSCRAASPTSG